MVAAAASPVRQRTARLRVWDPFVRLFHWALVGTVAAAALTGFLGDGQDMLVHVTAGLAAAALVTSRIVWGFLGPTHARFESFVPRPGRLLEHLRRLRQPDGPRHLGHNPLGAVMVVTLILIVLALAATGLVTLGGVLKSGPLAFLTTFAAGWSVRELHELLAFALLGLVALHLLGVVAESLRQRDNLVRAMVTGWKTAEAGDPLARISPARPGVALAVTGALGIGAVALWFGFAARPGLGVPTAPLDPLYAEECGACHVAYHPSVLPRASWRVMMAGLDDHFGEDASLDEATTASLARYLEANAAETFDTKAANRFRRVDPATPLAITATPFWQRTHDDLPDALFERRPIGSAGNCDACHRDAAAGTFHPFAIAIPAPETLP